MSVEQCGAVRLAFREAFTELGINIARMIREDPTWPVVDSMFSGDALRVLGDGPADEAKKAHIDDQRKSVHALSAMAFWMKTRALVEARFHSAEPFIRSDEVDLGMAPTPEHVAILFHSVCGTAAEYE